MALNLGAVDTFFDASMLFTVKDKEYRAPAIPADLGIWVKTVAARQAELGDDATDEELKAAREECGPPPLPQGYTETEAFLTRELVAELRADGVDPELINHLATTVFVRIAGGDGMALLFAQGADPKALMGNRAQRRAGAKAAKRAPAKKTAVKKASASQTTSTAKAATTRKAVSGSTTKSPSTPRKAAKASRGGTS